MHVVFWPREFFESKVLFTCCHHMSSSIQSALERTPMMNGVVSRIGSWLWGRGCCSAPLSRRSSHSAGERSVADTDYCPDFTSTLSLLHSLCSTCHFRLSLQPRTG